MSYLCAITLAGVSQLQKYDLSKFEKEIDNFNTKILENRVNAANVYLCSNNALISFVNIVDAISNLEILRRTTLSSGLYISTILSTGKFDIEIKNQKNLLHVIYGQDYLELKKDLRLFKGAGIYIDKNIDLISIKEKSLHNFYCPDPHQKTLIEFFDVRFNVEDLQRWKPIFDDYFFHLHNYAPEFSRYLLPLIINILQSAIQDEIVFNQIINYFIDYLKKVSKKKVPIYLEIVLLKFIDVIVVSKNIINNDNINQIVLQLKKSNLLKKEMRKFIYDERIISRKAIAFIHKKRIIDE